MGRLGAVLRWPLRLLRWPVRPRMAGLLVLVPAVVFLLLLWGVVEASDPRVLRETGEGGLLSLGDIAYSLQKPTLVLAALAVVLSLVAAGVVVIVDRIVTERYRTSLDLVRLPLAPRTVLKTDHALGTPLTVTAVIPAHDEEQTLAATLAALKAQSPAPHRIMVVADNCTDATVDVARAAGVEIHVTVGNTQRKAGALNQVLPGLTEWLGDNDLVLVLDADTHLEPGFLRAAIDRFAADRALMAVGGVFYGEPGHGLLGQFQRNEFTRYAREIKRRSGRVFVLTGTASLFRPRALETVAARRGTLLPGRLGDVYDTAALTEDNELTLALKSLGALMVSPEGCRVETELMPTWRELWHQRLRWHRGALENLGAYGVTMQTLRYWIQQWSLTYGALALAAYLLMMGITVLAVDDWVWFPFWLAIGGVFAFERLVTVWAGGWRARLIAVLLIPELVYSVFLNGVHLRGIYDITVARKAAWHRADALRPQFS